MACLPWSVTSVSHMHAYHYELVLIRWSRCWRHNAAGRWWQSWFSERHKNYPLYKKLSSHFGPIVEFRRFPLKWTFVFWAKLTNRSRSWTKTCAYSFICTAPGRGKSLMGFWTMSKYSLYLSLNFLCSALCTEAPESTINIRSSVSLAPSQENKT